MLKLIHCIRHIVGKIDDVSAENANIFVIGGGVMGASIAYHLAVRGENDILLIEKEDFFGLGATGRCAGGVRYQFATEINIRLSLASLPLLERFEEDIGQAIDYRKCGYLFLLSNLEDVAVFQRNLELQNQTSVQGPNGWMALKFAAGCQ